jgi:hypothetical protein
MPFVLSAVEEQKRMISQRWAQLIVADSDRVYPIESGEYLANRRRITDDDIDAVAYDLDGKGIAKMLCAPTQQGKRPHAEFKRLDHSRDFRAWRKSHFHLEISRSEFSLQAAVFSSQLKPEL